MNDKSLGQHISELKDLILGYIRQEVLSPLKGATRYIKRGLVGGVLAIIAGVFVSVGLLRTAQNLDVLDADRGAWSWLVYLGVGLVCAVAGVLFIIRGVRGGRSRREAKA